MIKTADCIEQLQTVVDSLRAEGVDLSSIVASLAAVIIQVTANDLANSANYLHSAAATLTVAARKPTAKSSV
jgi:hypothetical protein